METSDMKNQKDAELDPYKNTDEFDVIIDATKWDKIGYIKMRSLNYRYNLGQYHIKITLQFPNRLVYASLTNVVISKFRLCEKLEYLYSRNNKYYYEDISQLKSLTTIISEDDSYEGSDKCMIQDLFENNKLQHVQVTRGTKIVSNMTLSENIDYLNKFIIYDNAHLKLTINL